MQVRMRPALHVTVVHQQNRARLNIEAVHSNIRHRVTYYDHTHAAPHEVAKHTGPKLELIKCISESEDLPTSPRVSCHASNLVLVLPVSRRRLGSLLLRS